MGFTTRDPLGTDSSPGSEEWNFKQSFVNAVVGPGGGWGQTTGNPNPLSRNATTELFNIFTTDGLSRAYVEFSDGLATESTKTLEEINVIDLEEIYLVIISYVPNYTQAWSADSSEAGYNNHSTNTVDDIKVIYDGEVENLQSGGQSTTWTSYKSGTPSENQDDYQDDTYWPNNQKRYGLDPQHAQVNGSFYIDNLKGNIHFSSNISGKTVILDYISDSLGTDVEMKVHKFAEEAMYKWIAYAIVSTRANMPPYLIQQLKRERFAETRKAKLRLSNIKLEELTQILRGKSKHIKH